MKKTYLILFLIFSILFTSCKQKEKLSDKRNFSIQKIDEIDYITLENKTPKKIILSKIQNTWRLENNFPVNKEAINYLLETVRDMQIKRPVAVKEKENILQRMSVQRTQVIFYSKGEKIKTIYVGGDTQDQLGTYMILENSSEPYVLSIPGFNGYLSSRFSCNEDTWKNKTIFDFEDDQIESVEINYRNPEHSFKINTKEELAAEYFLNFKNIFCEKFLKSNKDFNIEEVKKRDPLFDINITLKNKEKITLLGFEKKSSLKGRTKNKKYDDERFYGLFHNELVLIQYKQFEKILKTKEELQIN